MIGGLVSDLEVYQFDNVYFYHIISYVLCVSISK